jgi:hypothetical protein
MKPHLLSEWPAAGEGPTMERMEPDGSSTIRFLPANGRPVAEGPLELPVRRRSDMKWIAGGHARCYPLDRRAYRKPWGVNWEASSRRPLSLRGDGPRRCWRSPEADIRVDLLVIWPLLALLTAWFTVRAVR